MYKFRTLRRGAERRLGQYLGEELVEHTQAEFTPIGKWLKATQLDEIPQFVNVLRGDMSLVGPRPIRPVFFDELAHELPSYWQRLVVRPGLTGLAQVRRGYETSMGEKLAHDLEWIADRSVRLYLRTVVATGWRVLKQSVGGLVRRGAPKVERVCGICGIATTHGVADVESLRAMAEQLVHRGPDSAGEHVDGGVALAARRLSIIDLEHGDQPIANEDGSCVVVQNGEIYNYPGAAPRARARGTRAADALRHRGARPPLRGARRRLRGAAARDVRGRDLGRTAPPAGARARPLRDQAALLPARRRRAALRVGAAGASARRDRPRRARGVPRLQLDPGPVLDLPRRPQAAGGARPRLGGRRGHARALCAARPGDGGRAARRRRGRAHRGATRSVARLGASASPL